MRRAAKLLPALAALFFLGACATSPDAGGDERAWVAYSTESGGSKLAYGTPDSDDVPLMFRCRPGSGRVMVMQGGLRPGDGITLAAGRERVTLHGGTEPDQVDEGLLMASETDADAAVLRTFIRTGRVTLGEGDRREILRATSAERVVIASFFQTCAGARPGQA